jgi:hypothetical protein
VSTGPDPTAEPAPDARGVTDQGLAALRVAATVLHGVPGLRGRLRQGSLTVAEIRRDATPDGPLPGPPRVLSPCEFRAAVIGARTRLDQGERLVIPGAEGDPVIDITVPATGRTFAGGIHRVPCAGRWLYAFTLCGATGLFAPLVEGVVAERAGRRPPGRLGLRPDEALGTVLCFVEQDGARRPDDRPVVELLADLLVRFTVEQVCAVPTPAS